MHEGRVGQKSRCAITRRSLFAAASLLATAIGTKVADAQLRPQPSPPPPPPGRGGHCYLRGTHILTPEGLRDIASLQIGDPVVTLTGAPRAIKWIGRNTFVRRADERWPLRAMPVKVARFALGGRTP